MKNTDKVIEKFREEANFINKIYGLSDEDHDTALDRGNIYHLMREYAKVIN